MKSHIEKIKSVNQKAHLSNDEKKLERYKIKGKAYFEVARDAVNYSWVENGITINIIKVGLDEDHRVIVFCEAWINGRQVELDLPFIYVNPPLSHQGSEDLFEVLKKIVFDTVVGSIKWLP